MRYTFKKDERLKSKRIIDALFTDGKVIAISPVKVFWLETELNSSQRAQFGVSVPKRQFSQAVDRNRIKRQMREAIRLNKAALTEKLAMKEKQYAMMILFTGKEPISQEVLSGKITSAFDRLIETV